MTTIATTWTIFDGPHDVAAQYHARRAVLRSACSPPAVWASMIFRARGVQALEWAAENGQVRNSNNQGLAMRDKLSPLHDIINNL